MNNLRKINEKKLKNIIAHVFNIPLEEITEFASIDTIENWDSFNHVILTLALEQEFSVSFEPDEIIEMLSYKIILLILEEKLSTETG